MSVHRKADEFKKLERKFAEEQGLVFSEYLKEEDVETVIAKHTPKHRKRKLSPLVTLWALLSQVLQDNCSCEKVVGKVSAFLSKAKREKVSVTASAYCQARERLPEKVVSELTKNVSDKVKARIPKERLWHGKNVAIVDGSSFSAADTQKNQQEYPQPDSQKAGCGFPFIRMIVAFCLATGLVLEVCLAPYEVSERVLMRQLFEKLEKGSIILLDRGGYSYCDALYLLHLGHDFVIRYKGKETLSGISFRCVKKYDEEIVWQSPKFKAIPKWAKEKMLICSSITIRKIRYRIEIKGFRTKEITLVTSLLDRYKYPFRDIAELYFSRWQAEINLRTIKTTMKMDMLKGKTPATVRKEVWAYMLAYNLIRSIIFEAAVLHDKSVYGISFRNTQDHIEEFQLEMRGEAPDTQSFLYKTLLYNVSKKLISLRNKIRFEPRRIKRRMKRFSLLIMHRHYYHSLILQGTYSDRK